MPMPPIIYRRQNGTNAEYHDAENRPARRRTLEISSKAEAAMEKLSRFFIDAGCQMKVNLRRLFRS